MNDARQTLRAYIQAKHPDAPDNALDELEAFADRTGLDATLGQIYLQSYNAFGGGTTWSVQTSIAGLKVVAERTGQFAGTDRIEYEYDDDGGLIAAHSTVYRMVQGMRCAFTGSAHWDEYDKKTHTWKTKGLLMLGKCAKAAGLRDGFAELGALYIPEEMDGDSMAVDNGDPYVDPYVAASVISAKVLHNQATVLPDPFASMSTTAEAGAAIATAKATLRESVYPTTGVPDPRGMGTVSSAGPIVHGGPQTGIDQATGQTVVIPTEGVVVREEHYNPAAEMAKAQRDAAAAKPDTLALLRGYVDNGVVTDATLVGHAQHLFGAEFEVPLTLAHIATDEDLGGLSDGERLQLLRSIEHSPDAIPEG